VNQNEHKPPNQSSIYTPIPLLEPFEPTENMFVMFKPTQMLKKSTKVLDCPEI